MWQLKAVVFSTIIFLSGSWSVAQEQPERRLASRSKNIQRQKGSLPTGKTFFKKSRVRKKELLKYVKPPASGRLYFQEGSDEARLEEVTLKEIKQLYELLKVSPRSDIQLRLASLYVEQARLIESRIYEKYTEDLELYKTKSLSKVPQLDLSVVQEYSKKAINLYESYIRKHPKGKHASEALFNLGFSYIQIGRPHSGKKYYDRLIRQYPKSNNIEDAYFHLGDYYFNQSNWKEARKYYSRASRYRSKFYSFSIYKIAWCFYNEGRISNSMKVLVNLIKESRIKTQGKALMFIDLSQEAINDLASFYIYSNYKANDAYTYFYNLINNEKGTLAILRKVGFAYKDVGEFKNMRFIFNLILKFEPLNRVAFEYKYEIVQAYAYKGNKKIFNQELTQWAQQYGPKSKWAKKNRSEKKLIKKSHKLMERTIRNYAFVIHHSFLKSKRKHIANQAIIAYKLYTQVFPKSEFDSDIRFQYGELLFDTGQYKKAVNQYTVVVNEYPKSKNHPVATWNRILALEEILPNEAKVKKSLEGQKGSVPFPRTVVAFEQAVKDYLKWYKKKPQAPQIIYTLANLHFEYRHYKTAIKYWMTLIKQYPLPKKTYYIQSIHLVLDTFNLIKDFNSLKKVSSLFLKDTTIKRLPVAKEIRKILRQVQFKEAQDLAENKDYKASAKMYEKFYQKNTGSDLNVFALYNAALNYDKSKDIVKSRYLYKILYNSPNLSKHPKIKKNVMRDITGIFQNSGRYLKAAQAYKEYATLYPKDKNSASFWYNAAIIFDGLNFYKSAESSYMKYFALSRGLEKNQVNFLIARMRERRRQYTNAIRFYQKYLNLPDKNKKAQVLSAYRIAELNRKLKKISEADRWYKTTIGVYRKTKQGVEYASAARFYFAEKIYNKFIRIRLSSNPNQQAQAMQSKLRLLNQLKEGIKGVIRLNYNPQIISSLVLMGLANHNLYNVIMKSSIPKGLDAQGKKDYKKGLLQTATPFKKVAQDYYKQAFKKAESGLSDTAWLRRAKRESLKFSDRSMEGTGILTIPQGVLR